MSKYPESTIDLSKALKKAESKTRLPVLTEEEVKEIEKKKDEKDKSGNKDKKDKK